MNKKVYEQMIADNAIVKIETYGGGYFQDIRGEIAIHFLFNHYDQMPNYSAKPFQRVDLQTFPLKNLPNQITAVPISSNVTIMVNADNSDYAQTYNISVDTIKRSVNLELTKRPDLGETLLTLEEINGIHLAY